MHMGIKIAPGKPDPRTCRAREPENGWTTHTAMVWTDHRQRALDRLEVQLYVVTSEALADSCCHLSVCSPVWTLFILPFVSMASVASHLTSATRLDPVAYILPQNSSRFII